MEHNPYSAPTAAVMDATSESGELELAGKGRRFANMVIDSIAQYTVVFAVAVVTAVVAPDLAGVVVQHSVLFSLAIMLCYYVGCEMLFGRTVGKLVTGTKVVTDTGEAPRFMQLVGRTLARMVPFEPFSFLSDPPIGWHDGWSNTRVVRTTTGTSVSPAFALRNSVDSPPISSSLGLR